MTVAALPSGVRQPNVGPQRASVPTAPVAQHQACAVRLIDRRTGQTHKINGSPLVLFTQRPDEASAELLEGRDPAVWDICIEPIGTGWRE